MTHEEKEVQQVFFYFTLLKRNGFVHFLLDVKINFLQKLSLCFY